MKPGLPVWRSLLYVPVNVEKYIDKAHTRGADCILLDLEDSVPAHEKDNARKLVAQAATRVRRGGADVAVRINRPDAMAPRDLEASVGPGVNAIAVTKVTTRPTCADSTSWFRDWKRSAALLLAIRASSPWSRLP